VAFTNYSIGHILTKTQAVEQIQLTSLQPPPDGAQYTMAAARNADGDLVLILQDQATHKNYVGTQDGLKPLAAGVVVGNELGITTAKGYKLIKGPELFAMDKQLRAFHVPTKGSAEIQPQTISSAVELEPTLRYVPKRDV